MLTPESKSRFIPGYFFGPFKEEVRRDRSIRVKMAHLALAHYDLPLHTVAVLLKIPGSYVVREELIPIPDPNICTCSEFNTPEYTRYNRELDKFIATLPLEQFTYPT